MSAMVAIVMLLLFVGIICLGVGMLATLSEIESVKRRVHELERVPPGSPIFSPIAIHKATQTYALPLDKQPWWPDGQRKLDI